MEKESLIITKALFIHKVDGIWSGGLLVALVDALLFRLVSPE